MLLSHTVIVENCWEWVGAHTVLGYGVVRRDNKNKSAHRLSYEAFVGPIPLGLELDHLCRNTKCINPAHLEPVTHQVNVLRGVGTPAVHAAKTHCDRGHEFSEKNTKTGPKGDRVCIECSRIRGRAWYYKHRERVAERRRLRLYGPRTGGLNL